MTDEKEILLEINNMISGLSKNTNLFIGIIDESAALKILNDTGINVFNYRVSYNKSDVMHWYKRHVLNTANRIQMKMNDLLKFIDLLNNYNKISIGFDYGGNKAIQLYGYYEGSMLCIAILSAGRNKITFKTMYYIEK